MTASSSNKSTTTSSILQMLRSRKTSSSSPHTTQHDNNGTTSSAHHRLTRQKKLRYLTDQDVGLNMQSGSSWASPDHPKHGFDFRPSSSSAVPHPLPLPTGSSPNASPSSTCPRKSMDHVSSATNVARSPRKFCRKFNQDLAQKNVTSNLNLNEPFNSAPGTGSASLPVSPERSYHKYLHISHVVTTPVEFVNSSLNESYHGQKVENSIERFRVKVPAKSAPASSLSSPNTSPRRTKAVDILPLLHSQEYQDRPASDSSGSIELAAATEVSLLRNVLSPDHSPPHSPKVQRPLLKPRTMDELIFPSHHSLLPGSYIERPGSSNHVASHPLPLPPRTSSAPISSTPTPSASTHQSVEKQNVSIIKGQWQKGRLIGQGTFGRVYAATNRQTGALCAMKEVDIIPDDPKSAECIKQLEQEIKLLSQLKHPNIVQYYGSEIVGDQLYIYLEYVHPGSINKYIREHCEIIEEPVVRNFTRHILSGLAYLHSEKTVHRDIKGANLLVNASGIVKLADFGLAKHLSGKAYDLSLKGSPYWMAPEIMQAAMLKDANPDLAFAVDIWSLGCTIIEMLTGKPPWSEVEGQVAMFKVLNKTPTIPDTLSSDGKDFLHCCFRRDPAARPSAAMLLEHSFVQNSHEQHVSVCTKALSRMELTDIYKPRSPKVYGKSTNVFLFNCMENRNGIRQCYSETGQQINSPVSARATDSCHNPFGNHEVHSPWTKQISCRESKLSQSTIFLTNRQLVELDNHHYPRLKSHQQDIPHL